MAIFEGSRYSLGENSKKITATKVDRDGRTITFLHDRKPYTKEDMRDAIQVHEVEPEELPDLISFVRCASSTKWFLFADINEMFYPDEELSAGRVILMPSLADFKSV